VKTRVVSYNYTSPSHCVGSTPSRDLPAARQSIGVDDPSRMGRRSHPPKHTRHTSTKSTSHGVGRGGTDSAINPSHHGHSLGKRHHESSGKSRYRKNGSASTRAENGYVRVDPADGWHGSMAKQALIDHRTRHRPQDTYSLFATVGWDSQHYSAQTGVRATKLRDKDWRTSVHRPTIITYRSRENIRLKPTVSRKKHAQSSSSNDRNGGRKPRKSRGRSRRRSSGAEGGCTETDLTQANLRSLRKSFEAKHEAAHKPTRVYPSGFPTHDTNRKMFYRSNQVTNVPQTSHRKAHEPRSDTSRAGETVSRSRGSDVEVDRRLENGNWDSITTDVSEQVERTYQRPHSLTAGLSDRRGSRPEGATRRSTQHYPSRSGVTRPGTDQPGRRRKPDHHHSSHTKYKRTVREDSDRGCRCTIL